MKIVGLHITAAGSVTLVAYDPHDTSSLETMQELVGGYLESAPVFDRKLTMYCNEEGKLLGLPINFVASLLIHPEVDDLIMGDVLIVGGPDEEGYDTDLPPFARLMSLQLQRGGGDDRTTHRGPHRSGEEGR